VEKYSGLNHKPIKPVSEDALKVLADFNWPGNVRELEHTIERAVVLSKGSEIEAPDLFLHGITVKSFQDRNWALPAPMGNQETENSTAKTTEGDAGNLTIADMERELILKTLKQVSYNRTKAAEILGITVRTLRNKINEYRAAGISIEEG
jgi:two-component system response regulator FlrC